MSPFYTEGDRRLGEKNSILHIPLIHYRSLYLSENPSNLTLRNNSLQKTPILLPVKNGVSFFGSIWHPLGERMMGLPISSSSA